MILITLPGNCVTRRLAFFLAMEEYVAKNMDGENDYFFTWQSEPTVIVGRNQVIEAETDIDYCRAENITLVRRKSGGGCVYSDMGNLMLSCVTKGENVGFVFNNYLRHIALILRKKGIHAEVTGRNDIIVDGKKISGNAFFKQPGSRRCVIHGTLLCNTDLRRMERVLTPSASKLESKGIASVRSRVANLEDISGIGIGEIREWIERSMCDDEHCLTVDEVAAIEKIEKTYSNPDFLFGKNPPFTISRTIRTSDSGEVCLNIELRNDIVRRVFITGDFLSESVSDGDISEALRGKQFNKDSITEALSGFDMSRYIQNLSTNDVIKSLFNN